MLYESCVKEGINVIWYNISQINLKNLAFQN